MRLGARSLGAGRLAAVAAVLCAITAAAQEAGSAVAELYVTSTPADAVISLDGEVRGNTPLTLSGVRPGTYLMKLSKRGYRDDLRTVKPAAQLNLALDIKLEAVTGLVLIQSTPSNAIVQIDGVDRGATPLLVTDLPVGNYRVRVAQTSFLAKELDLKVEDRVPILLETEFTSDSASLTISSEPPGANVSVNGIARGTTPCTAGGIPEGETKLQLTLDGYAPAEQSVRLAAGQEEEIQVRLVPLPASLTVESVPPEARIYIDNQFRGKAPLVLEKLDPGTYRIRAELPAHEPLARTIELKRADQVVEEFRLQANVGSLQITTQPAGAQLFIDGKEAGKTVAKPNQTDQVSEPLLVGALEPGTRTLKLTRTGYYTHDATVTIERDQTVVQHFELKRMFIPDCEVRTDSDVFQGVLTQVDPQGNVKLEVAPGVVKTIPADKIISRTPLRTQNPGE